MFSFSLPDHAVFMSQVESLWETINYNGIVGLVINLGCGAAIALIFWSLFSSADDSSDTGSINGDD